MNTYRFLSHLSHPFLIASLSTLWISVSVASAQSITPPFSWEEGFASPDTALKIQEVNRQNARIDMRLKAVGFAMLSISVRTLTLLLSVFSRSSRSA